MRALFPLSDRSRASIKDRNGARFNEQIRTYTRRKREEQEEEEMTRRRSASAMRICPATTRRSRNIRGRNVARISYTTTVGVIIVHGVETCQQQQRYPRRETKGSFHRRKREESFLDQPSSSHDPRFPRVIPCQARIIARRLPRYPSSSSSSSDSATIKRLTCLSIHPFCEIFPPYQIGY